MEPIDKDSEWTCGVCLEKCIYNCILQHSCFNAVEGMKNIRLKNIVKTVWPCSADGKEILMIDQKNNSLIKFLWANISKIYENNSMQLHQQYTFDLQQQQNISEAGTNDLNSNMQLQQQNIPQAGSLDSNKNLQEQHNIQHNELTTLASQDPNYNMQKQQQQQKTSQVGGYPLIKNKQQQNKSTTLTGRAPNNKMQQQQQQKKPSHSSDLRELLTPSPTSLTDDESDLLFNNDYDSQFDNNMIEDEPTDFQQLPTNDEQSNQFCESDPSELLIMLVESRPPLWDIKLDPALRCSRIKEKLWDEIAKTPVPETWWNQHMSVKEVKAKWKSLFDQYRTKVQQEQYNMKKSGSAALPKKPKWAYYDIMSFARDKCSVTQTFSNRPGRLVSNDDSDEENRNAVPTDTRKGRRSKKKSDYEESSVAALMLIAEKMDSSMPELPVMPELDGIDHALAVVSSNCRKAPADLCQMFLQKIVNMSFNISLNIGTDL